MKIKWKCVWKVLKPKIIAALLVLISGIVALMILKYAADVLFPTNSTQLYYANVGTGSAFGSVWIFIGLIISGAILVYMLIKALAEELKPCFIQE